MDLSNIVIYAIVAIIALFVLPKLGIGRRGGGNAPLNPPGNNPGGGGGLFPSSPDQPDEPDRPSAPRSGSGRTSGDFADRIEGQGPEKKA